MCLNESSLFFKVHVARRASTDDTSDCHKHGRSKKREIVFEQPRLVFADADDWFLHLGHVRREDDVQLPTESEV